jgi:hypothetical protein
MFRIGCKEKKKESDDGEDSMKLNSVFSHVLNSTIRRPITE